MEAARAQARYRRNDPVADEATAEVLARLLRLRIHLHFTGSRWCLSSLTLSVGQLRSVGVRRDEQIKLIKAKLLVPDRRSKAVCFRLADDALSLMAFARAASQAEPGSVGPIPRYDADFRELFIGDATILRLNSQASALTKLLENMEAAGWMRKVQSPLNGYEDGDEPQCLYDAASRLTHRQPLIEFHADRRSCRWCWKRLARLLAGHCTANQPAC